MTDDECMGMFDACAQHACELWDDANCTRAYIVRKRGGNIVSKRIARNVVDVYDTLVDVWNDPAVCVFLLPLRPRVNA